jgi:hypothetical protein
MGINAMDDITKIFVLKMAGYTGLCVGAFLLLACLVIAFNQ